MHPISVHLKSAPAPALMEPLRKRAGPKTLALLVVALAGGCVASTSAPAESAPSVATPSAAAPSVATASPSTQSPSTTAAPPEGRMIFGRFAAQGAEESLYLIDEEGERKIGEPADCGTCAHVSEDGRYLSTLTQSAGQFTFVVMRSDGTERRVFLSPSGASFGEGPFSGIHLYVGGADGIYRIEFGDFSNLARVTQGRQQIPLIAAPDGRHLLYFEPLTENQEHGNLFVVASDGAGARQVNPTGTRVARLPSVGVPGSFSPDSSRIAFAAYEGDQGNNLEPDESGIFVAAVAGGPAQRIGSLGTGTVSARWSPADGTIAFHRMLNGEYVLHVIDADGGGEKPLLEAGSVSSDSSWAPVWSPTGAWLAYQRGSSLQYELWIVRPDGSDGRRLTSQRSGLGGLLWAP